MRFWLEIKVRMLCNGPSLDLVTDPEMSLMGLEENQNAEWDWVIIIVCAPIDYNNGLFVFGRVLMTVAGWMRWEGILLNCQPAQEGKVK